MFETGLMLQWRDNFPENEAGQTPHHILVKLEEPSKEER
jgi:hypothetical protein